MKRDDARILQEVQKNTGMAMKAIDYISSKIYDDNLSIQVAKEAIKYSELYNKATEALIKERVPSYKSNGFKDLMLKSAINSNTLFNTSTGHIAELMIQGSNRGLTDMWKAINHHENAGNISMEIAKELMDFEEKNIEYLKQYL